MTTKDALKWGIEKLKKAGVETPVLDAEILLIHACHSPFRPKRRMDRSWIFAYSNNVVSSATLTRYKKLIARRGRREPVAYILGHKEFYGLDFLVNRNVLIPRPETELIVERVNYEIANLRNYESRDLTIVDVGTGSGAIAVAIAKNTPSIPPPSRGRIKVGGVRLFATDISTAALRLARKNARRNGVGTLSVPKTPLSGVEKQITFLRGNLLEPMLSNLYDRTNLTAKKLIITANLPYLSTLEWRATAPEVRKWEPRGALDGGRDGLKYYRELFEQLLKFLSSRGVSQTSDVAISSPVIGKRLPRSLRSLAMTIVCEICPEQVVPFKKMVRGYFSKADFEIVKDLAGKNRVVIVRL